MSAMGAKATMGRGNVFQSIIKRAPSVAYFGEKNKRRGGSASLVKIFFYQRQPPIMAPIAMAVTKLQPALIANHVHDFRSKKTWEAAPVA